MHFSLTRPAALNALIIADMSPRAYSADSHRRLIAALRSLNARRLRDRNLLDALLTLTEPVIRL